MTQNVTVRDTNPALGIWHRGQGFQPFDNPSLAETTETPMLFSPDTPPEDDYTTYDRFTVAGRSHTSYASAVIDATAHSYDGPGMACTVHGYHPVFRMWIPLQQFYDGLPIT